jgi:hypothetical protein
MAVRYPMTVIECKKSLIKLSANAPDAPDKYKVYRKGSTPADRYIECAGRKFNGSFEERKLYTFSVNQLILGGYLEFVQATEENTILCEEYELTYGGVLAVLDPSWDLNTNVNASLM